MWSPKQRAGRQTAKIQALSYVLRKGLKSTLFFFFFLERKTIQRTRMFKKHTQLLNVKSAIAALSAYRCRSRWRAASKARLQQALRSLSRSSWYILFSSSAFACQGFSSHPELSHVQSPCCPVRCTSLSILVDETIKSKVYGVFRMKPKERGTSLHWIS